MVLYRFPHCVLALPLLPSLACSAAAIEFKDVGQAAGVARSGETYGASWGDLNGDGYPDLFVSNHRTRPSLYLNTGRGTFIDVGVQTLDWTKRPNADTHGGSWADIDNDGDQDLLVATGAGTAQLLKNERGALIDRAAAAGLAGDSKDARLAVWLDYDGDRLPDFILTQMGGLSKVMHQASGMFTDQTAIVDMVCQRIQYAQFLDVNGDGRLDLVCPAANPFPQRVYDTLPVPWTDLTSYLPPVKQVVDTAIADFDNDGRMDVFYLSGVQLRPSAAVADGGNRIEAQLMGSEKGFNFVSGGRVTFDLAWSLDGGGLTRIYLGADGTHPAALPFTLNPSDPAVAGMPADTGEAPVARIGYDPAAQRWAVIIRFTGGDEAAWSNAYFQVSSTAAVSDLRTTGLQATDGAARPTLLMNNGSGFLDQTVAAGLSAPVQCVSVTAGDYDNDMDVDLYLGCRTGASNIANILYENQGDGTFVRVPDAGGAAGPIGVAVGSGAGTSDSVVTGDYDVDGYLDIFESNGFNMRPKGMGGPNKLYRNASRGNGNHWIELALVGTNSEHDVMGAVVTATANGVTQTRVVNGGYHRWSQEHVPLHFGLGEVTKVDLTVRWRAGGTLRSFRNIPVNQLYRLVEGSGLVTVTPGAALPYPCGLPDYDTATEAGIFIAKNCTNGTWQVRMSAGGSTGALNYSGRIVSSADFVSIEPKSVESYDQFDTSNASRISYVFRTSGNRWDGVDLVPQAGASTCFELDAPAGTAVYMGPLRERVSQRFDLETLGPCT